MATLQEYFNKYNKTEEGKVDAAVEFSGLPPAKMTTLQEYFNKYNKTEDDKVQAASEFAGLPPSKVKKSPGLLMSLLDILDRPGNATRALLVGKLGGLKGLIPFAQTIEDLTGWDIALNPDERVTGEEVLETWGGPKDVKGKFDTADVLGFLIEVIADPLWLVGVGGVTKAGKAAKVVKATHKSAKALGSADDLIRAMAKSGFPAKKIQDTVKNTITRDTLAAIHKSFRSGKALPPNVSKKLIKSFSTLYESGGPKGLFKARGWADEAVVGHRALLQLGLPGMRRPVIKGAGTLDKLDTIATSIRKGWVGEKFLHTTKRVSTGKQKDLHDIAVDAASAGKFNTQEAFTHIDNIAKDLTDDMFKDLPSLMEFTGGVNRAGNAIGALDEIAETYKVLDPETIVKKFKDLGIDVNIDEVAKWQSGFDEKVPKFITAHKERFTKDLQEMSDGLKGIYNKYGGTAGRKGKQLYHHSARKIDRFEPTKTGVWLNDNKAGYARRPNAKYANEAIVDVDNLKLANKKQATDLGLYRGDPKQFSKNLKEQGFDGAKMTVDKETHYFILDTDKLQSSVSQYDSISAAKLTNASDDYANLLRTQVDEEIRLGIPSSILKGKFEYFPRFFSKKYLKWRGKRSINLKHVGTNKGKTFSVKHGSQIARTKELRALSRDQIEELFRAKGFKGELFESPLASMAERVAKGNKTMGAANTIYDSVRQFGKHSDEAVDGMTDVAKVFSDTNLNPSDDLLKQLGIFDVKNMYIDDDIAHALKNQYDFTQTKAVEKAYSKIIKTYKSALTVFFPAFHSRNFMTAITMNFMDGVVNPRYYRKSIQLQKAAWLTRRIAKKQGINFAEASRQVRWPKVKTAGGTLDGAVFYQRLEKNRLVGEVAGHFGTTELNLGGRFSRRTGKQTRSKGVMDKAFGASMAMENNPRIANALAHAERMPLDEAIRNSKRVHFDYSDLSEAEKGIRNNVALFYTFARKNIAAQSQYLYQKPAKMAIFAKLAGGTPGAERRSNLPKYMQERVDIPTPFTDEEGRTINVRGVGLPIEEAFGPVSAPGTGVFDRISRFTSRQLSRTVPFIKTPIEVAAKRNLYFDKEIGNVAEFIGQALPTSRVTNTIQRFGRDDKLKTKAVDFVTGIKYGPAYEDYYKYLSEKDTIEEQLKRNPRFKSFTRYYPADKENVTPGEKALLDRLYKR